MNHNGTTNTTISCVVLVVVSFFLNGFTLQQGSLITPTGMVVAVGTTDLVGSHLFTLLLYGSCHSVNLRLFMK